MSHPVVIADNISKQYHLGPNSGKVRLGESFANAAQWFASAPLRLFQNKSAQGQSENSVLSPQQDSNEFWALKDVSFEVNQGEVFGIIGHNGAGKSTMLKILSRIIEPTTGKVRTRGRVSSLLEVGTGFHTDLTGRENIFLNGSILGMSKQEIRDKFDEIVEFSGVGQFLDTPVKFYSSGMYVRLGFAVAAHLEPEILIIDEVLAVGDAQFQRKCLHKMNEVTQQGRTVIVVSHNLQLVSNLCQRAILLDHGKLTAEGLPSDLIEGYVDFDETSKQGVIEWPSVLAPTNDDVRLRAIRIFQNGETSGKIDLSAEVEIEVEYDVLKPDHQWYASIGLKNAANVTAFTSTNLPNSALNHDEWIDRKLSPGRYASRVKIPARLLNTGTYSVSVVVGERFAAGKWLFCRTVISFLVTDENTKNTEPFGSWEGIFRPQLEWTTQELKGQ